VGMGGVVGERMFGGRGDRGHRWLGLSGRG